MSNKTEFEKNKEIRLKKASLFKEIALLMFDLTKLKKKQKEVKK